MGLEKIHSLIDLNHHLGREIDFLCEKVRKHVDENKELIRVKNDLVEERNELKEEIERRKVERDYLQDQMFALRKEKTELLKWKIIHSNSAPKKTTACLEINDDIEIDYMPDKSYREFMIIVLVYNEFREDSIGQSCFYDLLYDLGFKMNEVEKARKVIMNVDRCNVAIFDANGTKIET